MGLTTLAVTIAAVVVTAVFGGLTARRAAFDRVMNALDFISEGPVARARHRLGTILYEHSEEVLRGALLSGTDEERSERIEDLFIVLWAATRLEAVRRSLGHRRAAAGPHGLLEESTSNWVKYWMEPYQLNSRVSTRIDAVAQTIDATMDDDDTRAMTALYNRWCQRSVGMG